MTRSNFDDLVRPAGGDGASVLGRIPEIHFEAEAELDIQEMMGAWAIERQRAVEAELVLRETLRFLKRKLRSNRIMTPADRRETQELIRMIRSRLKQQF